MSDRVHGVGGAIEIRSAAGQGAEIRFSVPVRPRRPDVSLDP
jgi:signal transduction histidine kinase